MATVGQTGYLTPDIGWKRIEETSPLITFSGTWNSATYSDLYSGGYMKWAASGASIKIRFYGTKIRIITTKESNHGNNTITIDGVSETYNTYSPNKQYAVLSYEKTGLELGYHDVTITCESGKYFTLDAVEIDDTGYFIGQLTAPEPGWKRYDDTHPAFKRTGSWSLINDSAAYGGSQWYTTDVNAKLEFKFKGTKLRLLANTYTNKPNNIRISIDGGQEETFSEYDPSGVGKYLILSYEKTGLTDGIHNVVIQSPIGMSASLNWNIDAIDIDDTGRLLHPDEVLDPKDLDIGKRIRCHYESATSGQTGAFSGLGQETSDFIPPASSATPNGDFYFICVDKDYLGRWKLIADRNIQHSVSWDEINSKGFVNENIVFDLLAPLYKYRATVTKIYHNTSWWYTTSYPSGKGRTPDGRIIDAIYIVDNNKGKTGYDGGLSWFTNKLAFNELYFAEPVESIEYVYSGYPYNWATEVEVYSGENPSNVVKTTIDKAGWVNAPTVTAQPSNEKGMYQFYIRLLTGGINENDKDNEWDKYIVNSTLNGKIQAGDNNVWNWSGKWSLTSTTNKAGSSYRTVRGYSAANGSSYVSTSEANAANENFRPVLLIEELEKIRILFLVNNEWKKWDRAISSWVTVTTTPPTEDDFLNNGMDSLDGITSAELALLGDIDGVITIEMYTDDAIATSKNLNLTAIPLDKLVIPTGDINISHVSNIDSFTLNATVAGNGIIKTVVSFDMGKTWYAWDAAASQWVQVPLTAADVREKGMTPDVLNSITSENWNNLRGTSDTVRFAYLLSIESSTDVAQTDSLVSQFDMRGSWKHYKDADYEYRSNTLLQVKVYDNGDYKINY